MRLAIISDTHMPKGMRALPPACWRQLERADAILHAGDFVAASVLDALEAIGPPVHAVCGNVDSIEVAERLPETLELELTGTRIAMLHDSGPAQGRMARMRRRFPDVELVVFGHSHIPLLERGDDALVLLNPGSPTERRRAPSHTMALVRLGAGAPACELVTLD